MNSMTFGPGEEKLAQAFEQIEFLMRQVVRTNRRVVVDGFVIAALMHACPDVEAVRSLFQEACAAELTGGVLKTVSGHSIAEADEETETRVAYWNEQLNALVARDAPDPE